MDADHQTPELTQSNENTTNWNCVTSKKLLACYFEYFKETEENNGDTLRSTPADSKELTCSTEEYQQSVPILSENTWYKQLCKCLNCLQIYYKQNVDFLFGIKNIEWLPTEIIFMIFTYLLPSDRRVTSECCKRFLEIWFCDDFIDDRRLVFHCCVLDPEREPLSVFKKSSRNYRTLKFGDVIMRGESVFAGKCWENITTIDVGRKNLSLLSQFPNLKTAKVSTICRPVDFSNVPTTLELLSISCGFYEADKHDTLKLYLDKTSDAFRLELYLILSTKDILSFTESQRNKIQSVCLYLKAGDSEFKLPRFDNLKCLQLILDQWCDYGTENVLDNLENQCPAIKDLFISIWERLPHKIWTCLKSLSADDIPLEELSRLSIFVNLKKFGLAIRRERWTEDCFFVHESFLNKKLKTFEIDCSNIKDFCFTCFQTMTKSYPNMESLTCKIRVANDYLEDLATNTPKLKCLELTKFDPSVSFACLPNLTELRVSDILTPLLTETWPLMLHLRKLSLRSFSFNVVNVKIFDRMPALEDLTISCDEIDSDQLSLFEDLTKPVKRLQKIYISCAWIELEIYPDIIDIMAKNCKNLRKIRINDGKMKRYEEIFTPSLQKHSSIRCINGVWLK